MVTSKNRKTSAERRASKIYLAALKQAQSGKVANDVIARKLVEAHRLGSADASNALALWHLQGTHFKKDVRKAVPFLRRAAKAGIAEACFNLALCYERGEGVEKDVEVAFNLYLEAALRGDLDAQEQVYRCYWWGIGVKRNRRIADLWMDDVERRRAKR